MIEDTPILDSELDPVLWIKQAMAPHDAWIQWYCFESTHDPTYAVHAFKILEDAGTEITPRLYRVLLKIAQLAVSSPGGPPKPGKHRETVVRDANILLRLATLLEINEHSPKERRDRRKRDRPIEHVERRQAERDRREVERGWYERNPIDRRRFCNEVEQERRKIGKERRQIPNFVTGWRKRRGDIYAEIAAKFSTPERPLKAGSVERLWCREQEHRKSASQIDPKLDWRVCTISN